MVKNQNLLQFFFFVFSFFSPSILPFKYAGGHIVMAYMEMFGNCSHSTQNQTEFLRHSVHTYNVTHGASDHIATVGGGSMAIMSHQQSKNLTHSQTMR